MLVSLVDADRQFFKSSQGLPEPRASCRETPLSHSFCQHVVVLEEPLVIEDAREHPLVSDNLAIGDLGVVAYLGIPLLAPGGQPIGLLCAIQSSPRRWSEDDIALLSDLAASVMAEVAARIHLRELAAAEELLRRLNKTLPDSGNGRGGSSREPPHDRGRPDTDAAAPAEFGRQRPQVPPRRRASRRARVG